MTGICKLNKKNMRNFRRDTVYQCLVVDLAMLGVISKEECEMLLGSGIPKGLILPNGKQGHLISETNLPENGNVVVEPGTDDTGTDDTGTDDTGTDDTGTDDTEPEPEA